MFVNLGLNRFLVSIVKRREDFLFSPLCSVWEELLEVFVATEDPTAWEAVICSRARSSLSVTTPAWLSAIMAILAASIYSIPNKKGLVRFLNTTT